MSLKIVVAGYSQMFAAVIEGILEAGHNVVGVFRHERVIYDCARLFFKDYFNASEDITYIKSKKLYEIKASSINSEQFRNELLKLQADVLIIASWGERLSQKTIILPKIACINVHPSLLPKYRGPNPYLQVIKNMETKTGVTFHLVDNKYDTGAILTQVQVPIFNSDTGKILRTRCAMAAKSQLPELLNNLEFGMIIPTQQNEKFATYYPQIKMKDIIIDFNNSALQIDAHIRALVDWQSCYFQCKNVFFKIFSYKIKQNKTDYSKIGTIVAKSQNSLEILCAQNEIIEFIQPRLYGNLKKYFSEFYIKYNINVGEVI